MYIYKQFEPILLVQMTCVCEREEIAINILPFLPATSNPDCLLLSAFYSEIYLYTANLAILLVPQLISRFLGNSLVLRVNAV